jgi:excisionase family DNA binding protein
MNCVTVLLTSDELAERLRVRPATIRDWARRGRIPKVRLSYKVLRFEFSAVMSALTQSQVGGSRHA